LSISKSITLGGIRLITHRTYLNHYVCLCGSTEGILNSPKRLPVAPICSVSALTIIDLPLFPKVVSQCREKNSCLRCLCMKKQINHEIDPTVPRKTSDKETISFTLHVVKFHRFFVVRLFYFNEENNRPLILVIPLKYDQYPAIVLGRPLTSIRET